MDEEQPNFKVTDRRLFNADGSPRDLAPEEKPEPQPALEAPVTAGPVTAATQPEPAAPVQDPTASGESFETDESEMSEEEIAVKFTALGGDVIGKDQCEKLRKCIMNIDTANTVDELVSLTMAG